MVTTYRYDVADRLTSQWLDATGTAGDLTLRFMGYNPMSELMAQSVSNGVS